MVWSLGASHSEELSGLLVMQKAGNDGDALRAMGGATLRFGYVVIPMSSGWRDTRTPERESASWDCPTG
ncbi:hypothetical protein NDU88_006143 [Pleurodeles waltl]|uniref:Uncharacterized protein n=1 Tax=Pleurodeles waltl TaxID=8319 RepID=A0AAV7UNS4_PLEWA|nr:hypothetical protein NDU88_006143 [Pleurodeles waltl]